MNSILTIFMTKYLLDKMGQLSVMPAANAEAWYHTFVTTLYFLPILGAILPTRSSENFGSSSVVDRLLRRTRDIALMGSPVAHTIEPRYLLAVGCL